MIERGGKLRTMVIPDVTGKTLKTAIRHNVDRRARIMTDELRAYNGLDKEFAGHETMRHSTGEYVRGDAYTNTIESFFVMKKGINGIYHSASKKHLHWYLAEFEFRYNNRELDDGERVVAAIEAADGKRLRYRDPVDSKGVTRPTQLKPF